MDKLTKYNGNKDLRTNGLSFSECLNGLGPLPDEAVFIGMCSDGLPLLFNAWDNITSKPMFVNGGDTEFLQAVARHISERDNSYTQIDYMVLTNDISSWNASASRCAVVLDFCNPDSNRAIHALASWAHSNKDRRRVVFLLLDGIHGINHLDKNTLDDLRWLLLRGASHFVFVLAVGRIETYFMTDWLERFPTRMEKCDGHYTIPENGSLLHVYVPNPNL